MTFHVLLKIQHKKIRKYQTLHDILEFDYDISFLSLDILIFYLFSNVYFKRHNLFDCLCLKDTELGSKSSHGKNKVTNLYNNHTAQN